MSEAFSEIAPLLRDPKTGEGVEAGALAARVRGAGWLDFVGDDGGAEARPVGQGLCMQAPFVSRIYDDLWRPYLFPFLATQAVSADEEAFLLARLLDARGPVVDLSCGPGTFARRLHARAALRPVLGVDLSPSMLEQAVQTSPGVHFLRGDAYDLPLRDGAVQGVVNVAALHLYPDPAGVLREVRRVLAPGGAFVVVAFVSYFRALARLVRGFERSVGLVRYAVDEVVEMLHDAGFDDVEPFRFGGRAAFRAARR